MLRHFMNTNCNTCAVDVIKSKSRMGVIPFLLLVILPKCPFCIMAFTSTAMLCGEGINMEVSKTYNSGLTILITALLGLITLFTIFMSRKGKRTWYAVALTVFGIGIILFSVIKYGGQPLYYTGILFVFFGVWLNGSLPWLVRSVRNVSFMGRRDLVS